MGYPSDGDAILHTESSDDVILLCKPKLTKGVVPNLLCLENDIPIRQREPLFPHVENPFNNGLFKLAEVSLAALVKRLFVFLGAAEFLDVALPIAKLIGLDCKIPADRAKRLSCSQSFVGSSYHLELVADRKSSCGGHD